MSGLSSELQDSIKSQSCPALSESDEPKCEQTAAEFLQFLAKFRKEIVDFEDSAFDEHATRLNESVPINQYTGLCSQTLGCPVGGMSSSMLDSYLTTPQPILIPESLAQHYCPTGNITSSFTASATSPSQRDVTSRANGRKRKTSFSKDNSKNTTKINSKNTPPAGKPDSGLRHFSKTVLHKVQQKRVTSFDEVADEIFRELSETARHNPADQKFYDNRNVRRRVYDVLNVLVAMEMITKENKLITWVGLPTEIPEEQQQLEKEKKEMEETIGLKTAELQDLILQQIAYNNLIQKKQQQEQQSSLSTNSVVHLPFIVAKTTKNTVIAHRTSSDNFEHVFDFDNPFEILDDIEVLKRMGMAFGLENNLCTEQDLEISKTLVNKELEPYVMAMAKSGH